MVAVRPGHSRYNNLFEMEQTTTLDQVSAYLIQADEHCHRQHIITDLRTHEYMRQPHSPP